MVRATRSVSEPWLVHARYAVLGCIGWGARGSVFLVEDRATGELRALKVPDGEDDAGWSHQDPSHPNVLHVHERLEVGGSPAVVTELAEGGSLVGWMERNGALPLRLALEVCLQAAAALEHAHAVGVVHGDVKPRDLLVRADGTIALTNFGATADHDPAAFRAPERRHGGPADERTDVFGLGATLFRLVVGSRRLDAATLGERVELFVGLPAPIRGIVAGCCRTAPADRVLGMAEVRARLEAASGDAPPLPPETPPLFDGSVLTLAAFPPDAWADRVERLRERASRPPVPSDPATDDPPPSPAPASSVEWAGERARFLGVLLAVGGATFLGCALLLA